MLPVWFRLLATHPWGAPDCVPNAFNLPIPGVPSEQHQATVQCSGKTCTLQATGPFKGFVIGVSAGTVSTSAPSTKAMAANQCITHSARLSTNQVQFTLSDAAVVRAVVVFYRSGGVHSYATAQAVVATSKRALIVGAGPGGLGAARALHALGVDVTVYERGPPFPVDFNGPISKTYQAPTHSMYVKGSLLGTGVGGTQNINGAVFAPGTAADLARSVGVDVFDARIAQSSAATMVPHTVDPPMMWACINPADACDLASTASTNTMMSRRSIAFDLPSDIMIVGNCAVQSVTATTVTVAQAADRCVDVAIDQDTFVIVAAGALVTPELLGSKKYTGWNHYFSYEYTNVPLKQQILHEFSTFYFYLRNSKFS